mmetsp:Transcript_8042/g.23106  ORF Transcript_8042/g.23106 Transcript_8042/m.23106 type:complete len:300 (-) Transcript_8042:103-1002(-)
MMRIRVAILREIPCRRTSRPHAAGARATSVATIIQRNHVIRTSIFILVILIGSSRRGRIQTTGRPRLGIGGGSLESKVPERRRCVLLLHDGFAVPVSFHVLLLDECIALLTISNRIWTRRVECQFGLPGAVDLLVATSFHCGNVVLVPLLHSHRPHMAHIRPQLPVRFRTRRANECTHGFLNFGRRHQNGRPAGRRFQHRLAVDAGLVLCLALQSIQAAAQVAVRGRGGGGRSGNHGVRHAAGCLSFVCPVSRCAQWWWWLSLRFAPFSFLESTRDDAAVSEFLLSLNVQGGRVDWRMG